MEIAEHQNINMFRLWVFGGPLGQSLAVLILLSGLLTQWTFVKPASANPHVVGNPQEIRYEGSGGLILPPSVSIDDRNRVASCRDCAWKMTPVCIPGQQDYCDAGIRSCPGLIDHVRTWFRPNNGDWVETGWICLTTSSVTTVEGIERYLVENFHQYVPPLVPRCWPARGAIVRLPIVCESGQRPDLQVWSHTVAGHPVEVSASPQWVWDFHGSSLRTDNPGGPFPDWSVSHTFILSGEKDLLVNSLWRGSFTVGGLGPFAIDQQLKQTRTWTIPVGEARARLTGD